MDDCSVYVWDRGSEGVPPFFFFLVAHCSVHNDSMKSGGERRAHCTAARASESREHRRVEEGKATGGSSKAGRIYFYFSCSLSFWRFTLAAEPHLPVLLSVCLSDCLSLLKRFPPAFLCTFKEDITHTRVKEGDRISAGFCSVVEDCRIAGCLAGEAGTEPGQEAAGRWQRSQAEYFTRGCGWCWRGASWCCCQGREVRRHARLRAGAWGTRWTATAWGSTLCPKTSPEEPRGCE